MDRWKPRAKRDGDSEKGDWILECTCNESMKDF